jgi:hypothetical protein
VEQNLVELVLFHEGHIAVGFLDAAEQILLVHSRMKRSCGRFQNLKREILIDYLQRNQQGAGAHCLLGA